jgi:hypothetical protein
MANAMFYRFAMTSPNKLESLLALKIHLFVFVQLLMHLPRMRVDLHIYEKESEAIDTSTPLVRNGRRSDTEVILVYLRQEKKRVCVCSLQSSRPLLHEPLYDKCGYSVAKRMRVGNLRKSTPRTVFLIIAWSRLGWRT